MSGQIASAQESPVWDKRALKDSIMALLTKYQIFHNQLNNQTDPSLEREFIQYINNTPGGFAIYGMDVAPKGQSFISATFSPAITGFANSTLSSDERLILKRGLGFSGGFSYSYYFSDHWGIGSGAQLSEYSGRVSLSQFDSFVGFDLNFRDVLIDNDVWLIEVPLVLCWRTNLLKRWEFNAELGLYLGFRAFESMMSSAVNNNSGATLLNVISDSDWISRMNRINSGLQGTIAIKYKLNNRLGILIGGGLRQGISGLDKNTHLDFSSTRYLGQYNPLWGAPGKTINQAFFVNLGVTFMLNKEQN
ncbi:MAG: outer membrane beta-barrel protein [Bacteroidia bacterium]|nr:outer membrane beta-barrel protein [Bacteroidia bacterium]